MNFKEYPNFLFGTATSSYQIEGAVEEDGRHSSIWDDFCKQGGKVRNQDHGEIACDHYHRFKEDIAILKDLGVGAYRFSISWSRVITRDGKPNKKGIAFYQKCLDELAKYSIKAFVTLYHWDLPSWIEKRGGWLNRESVYLFEEYADLMSQKLKGVYAWTTLNEPFCSAYLGYGIGIHAPGKKNLKFAVQVGHHLLLAHGLAMAKLKANTPEVKAGIVLNLTPSYPLSESEGDLRASRLFDAFNVHWFLHPIFKGVYHNDLFELWPNTQPIILENDFEHIGIKNDYIGINYYTRSVVSKEGESIYEDLSNKVERTEMGWEVYPEGLSDVLKVINQQYDFPPIYITENGRACKDEIRDGEINDEERISYHKSHLEAVENVIKSGVDIKGYFAWSLMDNFEWVEGYQKRFGLYYVDYKTLERTPKKSALWYRDFLKKQ